MDSLATLKAALQEGLVTQADYDAVKAAFVRAQQIKSGFEAGLLKEDDYREVKRAFLASLQSLSVHAPAVALPDGTDVGLPAAAVPSSREPELAGASAATSNGTTSGILPANRPAPSPLPTAAAPAAPAEGQAQVPTNIPKVAGIKHKMAGKTSLSGISVGEDAVNLYYYLKAKSTYRWATWKINDAGNEVVIADVGDKDSPYATFLNALPPTDCRYGVYDYQVTNSEGRMFNKIVFVNWAPDNARVKNKMMYASTKDFFKSCLDGLSIEMQAADADDLREADVIESVRAVLTRS